MCSIHSFLQKLSKSQKFSFFLAFLTNFSIFIKEVVSLNPQSSFFLKKQHIYSTFKVGLQYATADFKGTVKLFVWDQNIHCDVEAYILNSDSNIQK